VQGTFSDTESGEYSVIDFAAIRIFGVLQRIALCYCAAALVLHYFNTRGAIVFSLATLFGYWALMYFFGDSGDPYSLAGNAAVKLDLWLLNPANPYKGEDVPFDPEGRKYT
jgi:predicted acyltransferase